MGAWAVSLWNVAVTGFVSDNSLLFSALVLCVSMAACMTGSGTDSTDQPGLPEVDCIYVRTTKKCRHASGKGGNRSKARKSYKLTLRSAFIAQFGGSCHCSGRGYGYLLRRRSVRWIFDHSRWKTRISSSQARHWDSVHSRMYGLVVSRLAGLRIHRLTRRGIPCSLDSWF